MLEPPLRSKPASDFEIKIAAGGEQALAQLVDYLAPPLHRHLSLEFSRSLTHEDRDDLMMRFIADVISGKVKYDARLAPLDAFAKVCVYRRAVDLLRKRGTQVQRDFNFGAATLLRLSQGSPLDDVAFAEAVERAKVALATMPVNYVAAIEARHRHGQNGYKAALVREHLISRETAAQWLHRGMEMLADATGLAAEHDS